MRIVVLATVTLVGLLAGGAKAQEGFCAPPTKGRKAACGPAEKVRTGEKTGEKPKDKSRGKPGEKARGKTGGVTAGKKGEKSTDRSVRPVIGNELTWVKVDGGMFEMGSKLGDPNERPVHQVVISGFEMATTEVTVGQYRRCVEAGACTVPGQGAECNYHLKNHEDHPVNCVDWAQAARFAEWVGGRLPTEAEWEYAARTGRTVGRQYMMTVEDFAKPAEGQHRRFTELDDIAWYQGNSGDKSHPVATRKAGGNGLYDMLGSVMEWVSDWYGDYAEGQVVNPTGPATGFVKIVRGGAWATHGVRVSASFRQHADPETQGAYVGFRPVRTPKPQEKAN